MTSSLHSSKTPTLEAPAPRRALRAGAPMLRYVAVRLVTLLVSLVLAAVVVFVVLRLLPGDSAGTTLGVGTTTDQLDQLRSEPRDRPVVARPAR